MAARDLLKPQSSLGSVAPISLPGVSMPTGPDPLLAATANMANSLSQRIGQMSQTMFKVAGTQAEAKGAAAGVQNAPTIKQIKWAKEHGQSVTLPGDAGSINIQEQAAYASSLKLTEARYGSLAREAALGEVTKAFMSDGEIKPDLLQKNLNDVLESYTGSLASVSQAGAAKLDIDLRNQFNNQLVAYSREWHSKDTKQRRAKAVARAHNILPEVAGYVVGDSKTRQSVGIAEHATSMLEREVLNMTVEGVPTSTIEAYKTTFQKRLDNALITSVTQWSQGSDAGGPLDAWNKLTKGTAPAGVMDAFDALPTDKQTKLRNDIYAENEKLEDIEEDRQTAIDDSLEAVSEMHMSNFLTASMNGDSAAMRQIVAQLAATDGKTAKLLLPLLGKAGDAGTDDAQVVRDLTLRIIKGQTDPKQRTYIKYDIVTAMTNGTLTETKAKQLINNLVSSRSHVFKAAESELRSLVRYNVAMNSINPTPEDRAALRLYERVMSKLHLASADPEMNLVALVETEVANEQDKVHAALVVEAQEALALRPVYNTVERVEEARATKSTLNSKAQTNWAAADRHVQIINRWGKAK